MADEPTAPADLETEILQAPDDIWQRLRAALRVNTREEAVALVKSDDRAAETARGILGQPGEEQSVLTQRRPSAASSYLTSRLRRPSAAETLYPTARGAGRMRF